MDNAEGKRYSRAIKIKKMRDIKVFKNSLDLSVDTDIDNKKQSFSADSKRVNVKLSKKLLRLK